VSALVPRLEAEGAATNDLWEKAIESSLSFANETLAQSLLSDNRAATIFNDLALRQLDG
jgi:hypothetical protein